MSSPRPEARGARLAERTIALDVLHSVKLALLEDARSLAQCSHPDLRNAFRRMSHEREAFYAEIAALVRRRDWRREPQATLQAAAQLLHHAARRESLRECLNQEARRSL